MRFLSMLVVMLAVCATSLVRTADRQATPQTGTQVCTFKVTGMTCAGCEAAVKIAARSIDGVKDVKARYANKSAEVTYDPTKTSPEAIAKAITEKSGFKVQPVQTAAKK